MKQSRVKVLNEESYVCDWCGKEMVFPTKTCAGCGKHACNESCHFMLVEYEGGRPAELDRAAHKHGTGIHLPSLCFCAVCRDTNQLAILLKKIKELDDELLKAFAAYRSTHSDLARRADRLIAKGIHE